MGQIGHLAFNDCFGRIQVLKQCIRGGWTTFRRTALSRMTTT